MLTRIDHRHVARLIAIGRLGLGTVMLLRPRAARSWLGDVVDEAAVKVAIRTLAGRDLVIGAGTLRALERGEALRPWLDYAAAADLTDAGATLLAIRSLPRTALGTIALAGAAAAASLAGRDHVD